ncbi:MAG: MATE family efflux transporter, partial [Ruminococcus sp.]
NLKYVKQTALIGMASFFNQVTMMVVQVVMNQLLRSYGDASVYGATVTIASAGIVMKVFQVFFSFIIGLAQGSQPIESYNYGAKQYDRVRGALFLTLGLGGVLSLAATIIFQVFPAEILSLFGKDDILYLEFGVKFFRVFLMAIIVDFFQPVVATFFTSIGKAYKGVFLSLTRQFIFFMPLLLILPRFYGLDGILYAGPAADLSAFAVTIIMMELELKNIKALERETKAAAV